MAAQLEAHTMQQQMNSEQRKEQSDGFLKVLNRLADGIMKIADKL